MALIARSSSYEVWKCFPNSQTSINRKWISDYFLFLFLSLSITSSSSITHLNLLSSWQENFVTNGIIDEKAEEIIRGIAKFPGSRVDDYSKLLKFNGCDIIIVWKPCNPVRLQELLINDNGYAIIFVTGGSSLKQISSSELQMMGFGLTFALEAKIDAGWNYGNGLELNGKNSTLEAVPSLSLEQIGEDGSIRVSSMEVTWTVVGGRDQLWTNFESFKKQKPEITCQIPTCEILSATSGVAWTVNDAAKLLSSFSDACNLPLPSTSRTSPVNNGEHSMSIATSGSDKFEENPCDYYYKMSLSSLLGKMREILFTAGRNIDSQIGAAIIGAVEFASLSVSQPNDNVNHITPFECLRLVCYALSCVLMLSSWMLNPRSSRATTANEKRLKALSHLTAGGAMICLFTGVFCNIFVLLPQPYAVCAIAICVFFLSGAAGITNEKPEEFIRGTVNNEDHCSTSMGTSGSDKFKENTSNYDYKILSCLLGKLPEVLFTAGRSIDSQIGAAIIGVGVASLPVSQPNDNGDCITPFECLGLVCYCSCCLLMLFSWMLNLTSRVTTVKEKRLKALSHLTAGGAMICLFTGVLCNIFALLSGPYAICAISICVFFLLGAAGYNAFSK